MKTKMAVNEMNYIVDAISQLFIPENNSATMLIID